MTDQDKEYKAILAELDNVTALVHKLKATPTEYIIDDILDSTFNLGLLCEDYIDFQVSDSINEYLSEMKESNDEY